jgi:lipopolysaccharide transport system ATP-binding protein
MEKEVLIKAEGVSKKFCRILKKSLIYGGRDIVMGFLGIEKNQELRPDEFWAVSDMNFEVRRGECLGLIGRNGAGKSTLLKMLNGLIRPDKGRIEMHGKVGALIELGAGFSPLLTGRQNVYNNGAVLGFTKEEINKKFDEIVEFAELNEFIDTPVQNYSSGMKVRLGFAIAAQMEPDILILDEILAVGDASFRAKCYNHIGKIKEKTAMIFVSHSMQQVAQICNSVLTMNKGKEIWLGDVGGGIKSYNSLNASDEQNDGFLSLAYPLDHVEINFDDLCLNYGENLNFNIKIFSLENILNCSFRLVFYNREGQLIAEWNGSRNNLKYDIIKGYNNISFSIGPLMLRAGQYKIGFALDDKTGISNPFWSYQQYEIEVGGSYSGSCEYQIK